MSGEANSKFSTITPKKTILGKLLTHKMFTAEKNKSPLLYFRSSFPGTDIYDITRNASESGQWQDASRNLNLLFRDYAFR